MCCFKHFNQPCTDAVSAVLQSVTYNPQASLANMFSLGTGMFQSVFDSFNNIPFIGGGGGGGFSFGGISFGSDDDSASSVVDSIINNDITAVVTVAQAMITAVKDTVNLAADGVAASLQTPVTGIALIQSVGEWVG